MKEIVERLHENRQVELAKNILESNGYSVSKESVNEDSEESREVLLQRMRDNETYKKLKNSCEKHGYELYSAVANLRDSGEGKLIHVDIRAPRGTYHPDIYINQDIWGEENTINIQIQTTAYGALTIEEYEKFLKGCQDAHDLVVEMNKLDFYELYDPKSENIED